VGVRRGGGRGYGERGVECGGEGEGEEGR